MNSFYFFTAKISESEPEYLVAYLGSSKFDYTQFSNELLKEFKKHIFIRNVVLLTPSFNQSDIENKISNKNLDILKDRINSLQNLNFHLCFVKRNGEVDSKAYGGNDQMVIKNLSHKKVNEIFDSGLYRLAKERELVVESSSNFHFVKPSGKHTNRFIKLANLLERTSEISFIACSLLKIIGKSFSKIYVDTSAIYPLAYEIARLQNLYERENNLIPIDSFGSYGGIDSYNFMCDENTLVLISASTSRDLYFKLRRENLVERAKIITIVSGGLDDDECNVRVSFNAFRKKFKDSFFETVLSYKENECLSCIDELSIPIPLDKSRFVFDGPRTELCLPIASDADSELKKLFHKYKDSNVFKCLFDGVNGSTSPNPEFFIDVSTLISSNTSFQESARNVIHRHFPINADAILYCKDKGAKELAEFSQREVGKLGKEVSIFESTFPKEFKPSSGIVVIAGSMQTGNSLLEISRYLRSFESLPITYLVGFAKYNSTDEYSKLCGDLVFSSGPLGKHSFHAIEKILVPINVHNQHAWDKEISTLNLIEQNFSDDPALVRAILARSKLLKEASSIEVEGLGVELFLSSPVGKLLKLGKTFAFWDREDTKSEFDHQATVYTTISSIMQRLRTVKRRNGVVPLGEGYIIRQLDPLLFDRFNEGIIQASFLRAAKSRELDYSASERNSKIVASLIERMFDSPEKIESEGLPEFMLALATKRLQLRKDHLNFLNQKSVDKAKYPMLWGITEFTKRELFQDAEKMKVPV